MEDDNEGVAARLGEVARSIGISVKPLKTANETTAALSAQLLVCLLAASHLVAGTSCTEESESPPVQMPPTCEITRPADGSSFDFGDSVVVEVDASDPDGGAVSVTFRVNGRIKDVDDSPPFVYVLSNIAYRVGDHSIETVARDEGQLEATDLVEISILSESTPVHGFEIVNTYPHDPSAFTQGLLFEGGCLYEGTGLWGQSSLSRIDLETGNVLMRRVIPREYFGEGITLWQDKIYQLTWLSGTGFIYSKESFDSLAVFFYDTEGWGLTNSDSELIMSDGTSTIYFRDPETFGVNRQITVKDDGRSVTYLNELEYIDGDIFANIWYHNRIARISTESGEVVAWIDLAAMCQAQPAGVLNGIAYDEDGDRLLVTGKNWDAIYEIVLTF